MDQHLSLFLQFSVKSAYITLIKHMISHIARAYTQLQAPFSQHRPKVTSNHTYSNQIAQLAFPVLLSLLSSQYRKIKPIN